jgi:hypothetical protein
MPSTRTEHLEIGTAAGAQSRHTAGEYRCFNHPDPPAAGANGSIEVMNCVDLGCIGSNAKHTRKGAFDNWIRLTRYIAALCRILDRRFG